jgi:hypothetical protein
MEYQIQGNTRRCAKSGKELQPGEKVFSVLLDQEGKLVRQDFSAVCWPGPPAGAFCFWSGKVPSTTTSRRPQFDDDLLLDCFHRLQGESDPGKVKFRYVLALLLMRRKRLKFEDAGRKEGSDQLRLRCVRTGTLFEVVNPQLSDEEMLTVQEEVFRVLGWE